MKSLAITGQLVAVVLISSCGPEGSRGLPSSPSATPATAMTATTSSHSGDLGVASQPSTAGSAAPTSRGVSNDASVPSPSTSSGSAGGPQEPDDAGLERDASQPMPIQDASITSKPQPEPQPTGVETLFWLDILGNAVIRASGNGWTDQKVIVSGNGISAPDGIAVDPQRGKLYWTNMGNVLGLGGGTVQRANLDGSQVETLVPANVSQTPKQMQLDLLNGLMYWCDREGAKVWRARLDGSAPEAIVSDAGFAQLVGIALDVPNRKFYFSDRVQQTILRANLDMPAGETSSTRSDIEELFQFRGNASPIDLELDLEHRMLYWTDRGLGTLNRASVDVPAGATASSRTDAVVLVSGLSDPIGLSLDREHARIYYTEVGGRVWQANLDGSSATPIATQLSATGITYVRLPAN